MLICDAVTHIANWATSSLHEISNFEQIEVGSHAGALLGAVWV